MKKKIFSSLLLVAFAFAATSMFVSCKDYDDDINELRSLIDKNDSALRQALESQKTELMGYIQTLQGQMRDAQADITTLKGQMTTAQGDITTLKGQMTDALARISTLEGKMDAAEDAITAINNLLGGKLENGKTYKAAVEEIYGKVASLETDMAKVLEEEIPGLKDSIGLLRAVDADLQLQINTLNTFKKKMEEEVIPGLQLRDTQLSDSIKDIISQLGVIREAVRTNAIAIGEINNMIGGKLENGQTYKEFVEQLRKDLNKANDDIEDLQEGLSQLNVLIKTSLRSLVFKPALYYEGIEACKLSTLTYLKYDIPAAAWNVQETKGYNDQERYPTTDGFKVLSFVAQYYMNPSSADLSNASVKVIDEDKEYVLDRASEAGLTVKNWKPENGMLNVNLRVKDNSKIKSVKADSMVTVFATQVTIANGAQGDTTITSDWAAVVAENISDLKLAHQNKTEKNPIPWTGVCNTTTDDMMCELVEPGHLFQTVYDAKNVAAQDTVDWNKTLDLKTLVETHYTTIDGQTHKKMDDATLAANGLEYKFELTSLILGENMTDESAHAAIQGSIFRPQPASADGKQQNYGADQVRASEVGRTPMVRVSLIDKETGDVLDYGYIRIRITETAEDKPEKPAEYITYTGTGYSYNGECTPAEWSYKTTWNQTEYDLYHKVNATREEWEANYGEPVKGDNNAFQQYEMKSPGVFVKSENPIGTINAYHESNASESGTLTHTLEWTLTSSDAYKYFITNKKNVPYKRAIKYESKDKTLWPDVYVLFETGSDVIQTTPRLKLNINGETAINNYWYTHNNGDEGFDEIRTNTLTPEDNAGGKADKLDATFSNVFVGNLTDLSKLVTVEQDNTPNNEYKAETIKLSFEFSAINKGKEFKGVSGKTYVLSGSTANGVMLAYYAYAYEKNDPAKKTELIATIEPMQAGTAATQIIKYADTDYAKDLLNYVAAQELNDDAITLKIAGRFTNPNCSKVAATAGTVDVRFLRPLNVYSGDKTIEDASVQGLQEIKLEDLVTFNDWRLAWNGVENTRGKGGAYQTYYGIEKISIENVENGQVISTNPEVKGNLGTDGEFVSLKSVSDQLDFVYNDGKLTYKNLSNTLTEFSLQIPVTVEYIWGKVPVIATVKVIRTHANAKKN